jgi:hypothetical protein|tara:strand:- start:28 stop:228 length:201 start_codon:yes stop_codon:yes gene_type:complete
MKWEPTAADMVQVTCTDTEKVVQGDILSRSHDRLRVNINGIPLVFYKTKPRMYVANSSGLEFVITL